MSFIIIMWQSISTAPYDRDLELAVLNHVGKHTLVFPCRRTETGTWINAMTKKRVEVQPTHWREWPGKDHRGRLH